MLTKQFAWTMLILVLTLVLVACTGPQQGDTGPVGNSVDLVRVTSTRTPVASTVSTAALAETASDTAIEATMSPPSSTIQLRSIQTATKMAPEAIPVMPDFQPEPTPVDPFLQGLISQAKDDLSRRIKIELGQIRTVKIDQVIWPDASLGCPQPGMGYAQVSQEGYLILLQAGERIYRYHSGDPSHPPFLCQSPVDPNITLPPPRD